MGSTGSMLESGGFKVPNQWHTVDYIDDIKVVAPNEGNNNHGLPAISNTPGTKYILMDKDNNFHQLKKYGDNRKPLYDIDYGWHNHKLTFHIHYYKNGVKQSKDYHVPQSLILKYYNIFKGVPKKWLK